MRSLRVVQGATGEEVARLECMSLHPSVRAAVPRHRAESRLPGFFDRITAMRDATTESDPSLMDEVMGGGDVA